MLYTTYKPLYNRFKIALCFWVWEFPAVHMYAVRLIEIIPNNLDFLLPLLKVTNTSNVKG